MSDHEEQRRDKQPPYIDEGLLINTRLSEIERQQAEEKKYQREYNSKQLRFNSRLVLFTALLFVTSVVSDLLMLRYVILTKQSADAASVGAVAATSAAGTARNSLEIDQRAWAVIGNVHIDSELSVGQPIAVIVTVANTGKTPVLHATIKDGLGLVSVASEPPATDWNSVRDNNQGVIFPNALSENIRLETSGSDS